MYLVSCLLECCVCLLAGVFVNIVFAVCMLVGGAVLVKADSVSVVNCGQCFLVTRFVVHDVWLCSVVDNMVISGDDVWHSGRCICV